MRSSSGLTVIASDRFRAKSQHRERAARPDRALLVFPADAGDAPALLPPRRARDLFRPKARPHSDADVPSRKQRGRAFGRNKSRSEEHTSELQSHLNLVCRLLLEKKTN